MLKATWLFDKSTLGIVTPTPAPESALKDAEYVYGVRLTSATAPDPFPPVNSITGTSS